MNNEDYLGITALALSTIAEVLAASMNPDDVRPILMGHIHEATIKWQCNGEWNGKKGANVKADFVAEVKASVDAVQQWRDKHTLVNPDAN